MRIAVALAIFRVSVLAWAEYRAYSERWSLAVVNALWFLRPETLLAEYTSVGEIRFGSETLHPPFRALLLTAGSFLLAIPVLFVSWLGRRRRKS